MKPDYEEYHAELGSIRYYQENGRWRYVHAQGEGSDLPSLESAQIEIETFLKAELTELASATPLPRDPQLVGNHRAYESEGSGGYIHCVYETRECSCEIIGSGTERHPLAIRYCQQHAAAPKLLDACKLLVGVKQWAEKHNKRSLLDVCDWSRVEAAIADAEGLATEGGAQ